jgi:hypothetical protein
MEHNRMETVSLQGVMVCIVAEDRDLVGHFRIVDNGSFHVCGTNVGSIVKQIERMAMVMCLKGVPLKLNMKEVAV